MEQSTDAEAISVFDMIKVGIGPSSSHTMGPWKAAQKSVEELTARSLRSRVTRAEVTLYGSLALTGAGHGTNMAVVLGLAGFDYLTVDTHAVREHAHSLREIGRLPLGGESDSEVPFELNHVREPLDFHPNGLRFAFFLEGGETYETTYYSIGGGFVTKEGTASDATSVSLPHPTQTAEDLLEHCRATGRSIAGVVFENEKTWRAPKDIHARLDRIWEAIQECVYRGCHAEKGELPGGLEVQRRAPDMARTLLERTSTTPAPASANAGATEAPSQNAGGRKAWLARLQDQDPSFHNTLKWVSCFALAANEENASFGRIVTAPTNGACGVIPAVLFYYVYLCRETEASTRDVRQFLLVAGELGSLFKKGATISAAMGGCQAEIGVSSAMAAGALTECLGGTPEQALRAAEIAMEHHLGLTCDPVGGLVQIPCIERNSMGAVKAITASNMAREGDVSEAKVSLDTVIESMWDTARDMNSKYKETAEGGLASHITVNVTEC